MCDGVARMGSVSWLGLAQNGSKAAPAEAEPLLHAATDGHFQAIAGYTKTVAVHPHSPGAVVHFEHAAPQRAVGVDDFPGDGSLFARVSAGVARDLRN